MQQNWDLILLENSMLDLLQVFLALKSRIFLVCSSRHLIAILEKWEQNNAIERTSFWGGVFSSNMAAMSLFYESKGLPPSQHIDCFQSDYCSFNDVSKI